MEAMIIEISALLRASHKKSDIATLLNVSRMSVHRVGSRLRDGETLKDRPHTSRPRVGIPTRWCACTHRKKCSGVAGVKHELLAKGLLAATVA